MRMQCGVVLYCEEFPRTAGEIMYMSLIINILDYVDYEKCQTQNFVFDVSFLWLVNECMRICSPAVCNTGVKL